MKIFILSLVFLFSCSSAPTKADAPVKKATTTTDQIQNSFSISKDGVTGLVVKDGDVFIADKLIGKMLGPTMVTPERSVVATIENKHILDSKGKTLVMLDEAGNLDNGSGTLLSWSPGGHFMKGDEDSGFVLEPNDPKLYKSASMVLFLYLFMPGDAAKEVKPIGTPEVVVD